MEVFAWHVSKMNMKSKEEIKDTNLTSEANHRKPEQVLRRTFLD